MYFPPLFFSLSLTLLTNKPPKKAENNERGKQNNAAVVIIAVAIRRTMFTWCKREMFRYVYPSIHDDKWLNAFLFIIRYFFRIYFKTFNLNLTRKKANRTTTTWGIEQPLGPYGAYENGMEFRLVTADCYYILFFRVYLTSICWYLFVCLIPLSFFSVVVAVYFKWFCVCVCRQNKQIFYHRNTNREQKGGKDDEYKHVVNGTRART